MVLERTSSRRQPDSILNIPQKDYDLTPTLCGGRIVLADAKVTRMTKEKG
jgi:hypothetical protein